MKSKMKSAEMSAEMKSEVKSEMESEMNSEMKERPAPWRPQPLYLLTVVEIQWPCLLSCRRMSLEVAAAATC